MFTDILFVLKKRLYCSLSFAMSRCQSLVSLSVLLSYVQSQEGTTEVDLSDYANYADAVGQIGRFFDEVYMHKRIHSSLGYLTLAEFEDQWRKEQTCEQKGEVIDEQQRV